MKKKFIEIMRLSCLLIMALVISSWGMTDLAMAQKKKVKTKKKKEVYQLSTEDQNFLEDLQRRSFRYFWDHSDPQTGLTLDRSRTDGSSLPTTHASHNIASSAATGFALSSLCIAADRGWISSTEAKERTRKTLDFFANRAFHKNGWFYHWLDKVSGERRWNSEISSIDTTLLLGGVLTARQCFSDDAQIVKLATKIYERVDFQWMLNGTNQFSHGWKPETGFLPISWTDYSEQMMLYILAVGSPTYPVSPNVWNGWIRQWKEYFGYRYIAAVSPLFIHQFSHAYVDFRGKREQKTKVDYFLNSVKATKAQKAFFLSLRKEFPQYGENMWGLTASDSELGYIAWGAPPREPAIDGTVVPCASAGSLMFTPEITLPVLKEIKQRFPNTYGIYGFTDAFNPHNGWINPDVIGIDVGITIVSAENLRSGKIWSWFMQNPEMRKGLWRVKVR